jgi:hypothetical protein
MTNGADQPDQPANRSAADGSVTISGGTFSGVNTVGQGNTVRVGSVTIGADQADQLAELRQLVEALVSTLAGPAEHAVAHEQATQLTEELAEPAPEPGRVRRIWSRLSGTLAALSTVGADVQKIAELIGHLFTG